jgi:hypothetical protein
MQALLGDPARREQLRQAGLAQAAGRTWAVAAEALARQVAAQARIQPA